MALNYYDKVDQYEFSTLANTLGTSLSRKPTLLYFGDSITALNHDVTASPTRTSDRGIIEWAHSLSGQRFQFVANSGIPGDTTVGMLARFNTDVAAYKPNFVTLMAGTNDIGNGLANPIANLRTLYQQINSIGAYVFALSILPRPGLSQTQQQSIIQINRWMAEFWKNNNGGEFVDLFSSIVDPQSTTQALIDSNYLSDTIHPSNIGAYQMGKVLAKSFLKFGYPSPLISSVQEEYTTIAGGNVVSSNGLMAGSSGVASSPVTGTVANGWTISATLGGGGTAVASVVARADGIGNDQQIVVTSVANNDFVSMKQTTNLFIPGMLVVGDLYYVECEVTVINPVNMGLLYMYAFAPTTGGAPGANTNTGDASLVKAYKEGYTSVLRSPVAPVLPGTTTIQIQMNTTFLGAGGATIKWGRAAVRKYIYK